MSAEHIIGVDFGTSTSVIRVKRYIDGVPAGLNQGGRLETKEVMFNDFKIVPTLILRTDKGTYYGADALGHQKGDILYQGFKVNLESSDASEREEARALTKEFLAYMAKKYKEQSEKSYLGEPDDKKRTIISYPVKWSEETKQFMRAAAKEVGFPNVDGMDEAQAAINAVTVQCEDYLKKKGYLEFGVPCNILLIDMGAGTTDLVLCHYTPGEQPKNEIICTYPKDGDILFGGQEVEEILCSYIQDFLAEYDIPKKEIEIRIHKLQKNISFKSWKEANVSKRLGSGETVKEFNALEETFISSKVNPFDDDDLNLNRTVFEKYANEYLKKFPKLVNGCIKESGTDKNDIDLVILTGGHSQWYFVKEMLIGKLPQFDEIDLPQIRKNPDRIIHISRPQETVALGLVYTPMAADFSKKKTEDESKISNLLEDELQKNHELKEYYSKNINSVFFIYENCISFVKADGKIISNNAEISSWDDIDSVSCGASYNMIALKKNGTVITLGNNDCNQCNVQDWKNIISVICCSVRNIGLRKDGTVVAAGYNEYGECDVQDWKDIVSIAAGYHTVGLKKDGTVISAGPNGNDSRRNVNEWRNIISVDCGLKHTVGLKKDGTVVATGDNSKGQCNVQNWWNIAAISCCDFITVGLKKDGTVISTYDKIKFDDWSDIIAVTAVSFNYKQKSQHIAFFGITEDGHVLFKNYEKTKKVKYKFTESKRLPYRLFMSNDEICSKYKNVVNDSNEKMDGNIFDKKIDIFALSGCIDISNELDW